MSGLTHAQPFPNRPIRLISPYPPGGGNDVLARLIAEKMGEGLGQRVIVDNRAGANTIVGTDIVAKSAPDGHTMVLVPNSFVTNPGFYAKLPYDTVRDFAPVALVALSPQILVVTLRQSLRSRCRRKYSSCIRPSPRPP
ncbi:MAG: tripartite tricarboxylate transporter substrate-binding protein [Proteobacteria bacterium]|nr:tripartite tricarboxylate transporter substrate-binding protein [Pseudomonadota bacterium]